MIIDIHSHILPNLDDGSKTPEDTRKLLSLLGKEGVEGVFATPHYVTGVYEKSREEVEGVIRSLGLEGEVLPGQEIALDETTLEKVRQGVLSGLGESPCLLVELPFYDYRPEEVLGQVFELQREGWQVIIAHPERYEYFQEDPLLLNDFIRGGCYFQVTGVSLEPDFGKPSHVLAWELVSLGCVDFIGSDAHGLHHRPPRVKPAWDVLEYRNPMAALAVRMNGAAVYAGEGLQEKSRELFGGRRRHFFK